MCSFSLEACTISSKENQKAFEICCQSYFRAFKGLEIEEMYLFLVFYVVHNFHSGLKVDHRIEYHCSTIHILI